MKIRITKCTSTEKGTLEEWYKDKIGMDFIAFECTQWYHWVIYNNLAGNPCRGLVNVEDCEVLEDDGS